MARKKLSYFKESGYRFPRLAWFFDLKVFYAFLAVVFAYVAFSSLSGGYASYREILRTPEKTSPYMNIQAKDFPGLKWARGMVSDPPDGISSDSWTVSDSVRPSHPFSSGCSLGDVPDSILASSSATGGGASVTALSFSPGQASAQLEKYTDILKGCYTGLSSAYDRLESLGYATSSGVFLDERTFMIQMGDGMLGVVAPDAGSRDGLFDFYAKKMNDTLIENGCTSIAEPTKDAYRNPYYNEKEYTGLIETQKVSTDVDVSNLPSPIFQGILSSPASSVKEPESPLPEGFPTLPSEKVEKPSSVTPVEDIDPTQNASFQVEDVVGPGCGWAFSGMKTPEYDKTKLKNDKSNAVLEAKNNADKTATDYVGRKIDFGVMSLMYMAQVDRWNSYVDSVNKVYEKWNWLNEQRAALKPSWDRYIQEWKDWYTFDDRLKEASDKYDTELKECKKKQDELDEWERKYGDLYDEIISSGRGGSKSSPSPSATPSIPAKPEGCQSLPERPAILDQSRPEEPQPPQIPDGVTIPDSWEKPEVQ